MYICESQRHEAGLIPRKRTYRSAILGAGSIEELNRLVSKINVIN